MPRTTIVSGGIQPIHRQASLDFSSEVLGSGGLYRSLPPFFVHSHAHLIGHLLGCLSRGEDPRVVVVVVVYPGIESSSSRVS